MGDEKSRTSGEASPGPYSTSAHEAMDWLFTRIGSWTHARWDQHLRNEVGDVSADRIIEALGYELRPAGEAPELRRESDQPCEKKPSLSPSASAATSETSTTENAPSTTALASASTRSSPSPNARADGWRGGDQRWPRGECSDYDLGFDDGRTAGLSSSLAYTAEDINRTYRGAIEACAQIAVREQEYWSERDHAGQAAAENLEWLIRKMSDQFTSPAPKPLTLASDAAVDASIKRITATHRDLMQGLAAGHSSGRECPLNLLGHSGFSLGGGCPGCDAEYARIMVDGLSRKEGDCAPPVVDPKVLEERRPQSPESLVGGPASPNACATPPCFTDVARQFVHTCSAHAAPTPGVSDLCALANKLRVARNALGEITHRSLTIAHAQQVALEALEVLATDTQVSSPAPKGKP